MFDNVLNTHLQSATCLGKLRMLIRLIQLPRKFTNFKIETVIMHFVQLWVQSKLDKMDMV